VAGHLIPGMRLVISGRDLAEVGLDDAIVVVNDSVYDVSGLTLTGQRSIVEDIIYHLAPGAEVYADVNCYRMGIPLRSQ